MKASHFQPFAMPSALGRRCHTFGQFDLSLDTTSFPLACIIIIDYKPQNMLCVRHRRPFLYISPKAPTLTLSFPLIKSLPVPLCTPSLLHLAGGTSVSKGQGINPVIFAATTYDFARVSFSEQSMLIRESTLRLEMLRLMVPFLMLHLNVVSYHRSSRLRKGITHAKTLSELEVV
jgi:hypothetical protein